MNIQRKSQTPNAMLDLFKMLQIGKNIFSQKKKRCPDFTQIRFSEEFEPNKMPKTI